MDTRRFNTPVLLSIIASTCVFLASSIIYAHMTPRKPSHSARGAVGFAMPGDHQNLDRGTYTIQTRETNPLVLGTVHIKRNNTFTYTPVNAEKSREGTVAYSSTHDAYLFTTNEGRELFRVLGTPERQHEVVWPTQQHNNVFYLDH